ncbi:MAG TPA: cupin domain-containing protein [Gemmatimonadaceae bacterium]|nr:cupin domain-containing protein [Gemmatimonadaceae bacterium]
MSETKLAGRMFGVAMALVIMHGGANAQMAQQVGEAKWGPAPPMLPAGAQISVVSGDPGKSAPYTVRLKFPAGYAIPAHSHPTDENVVVVSGAFIVGMGDKLDKTAGTALTPGGISQLTAGMNHFAYTKQPTTIILYGIGPVDLKYVNPKDDPRNSMTKKP